jgi:hypothetical protein
LWAIVLGQGQKICLWQIVKIVLLRKICFNKQDFSPSRQIFSCGNGFVFCLPPVMLVKIYGQTNYESAGQLIAQSQLALMGEQAVKTNKRFLCNV